MNEVEESVERDGDLDIFQLASFLWSRKFFIIGTAATCVVCSVLYIFLAKVTYRAEVLLEPTDSKSPLGISGALGGLGSLANLAGLNLPRDDSAEPIAVLTSRAFTGAFLEDQHLLPVLYPNRWDASKNQWKYSIFFDRPDLRDAVTLFNKKIRSVQVDRKTGFVTMSIEWRDPYIAAAWANLLVERLNDRMRNRAFSEAQMNVTYLKQELAASNVVTLQQSIGRVLESELQRLMLARANKEFSFRIIDPATPPKRPSWPKPVVIVLVALLLGILISIFYLLIRQSIANRLVGAQSFIGQN